MEKITAELTEHQVSIIRELCDLALRTGGINNLSAIIEVSQAISIIPDEDKNINK